MGEYYTISLNLKGHKCLVVGGGKVAERKVQTLLNCGANVFVVSPDVTSQLFSQANSGTIDYIARKYKSTDLADVFLVISATNDDKTNRQVAEDCFMRKILINVVDDLPNCNFIVPATLRRGPLTISISTEGKSPMLARTIREQLEQQFGPEYGSFLEIMGQVRQRAIREIPDEIKRRQIFEYLIKSDLLELIKSGQDYKVKERIEYVFGDSWVKP